MKTQLKNFKDSMYDYNNINEYYSYYGSVIYISPSYILNDDYFIILKNNNDYSLVKVLKEDLKEVESYVNREPLIEKLKSLKDNIAWVKGYGNLQQYIAFYVNEYDDINPMDKNALIKIKNHDLNFLSTIMIEDLVNLYKVGSTLTHNFFIDSRELKRGVFNNAVVITNIYSTNFSVEVRWVTGNSFIDIDIYYSSFKMKRTLFIYDIREFSILLKIISHKNELNSLEAIKGFTTE